MVEGMQRQTRPPLEAPRGLQGRYDVVSYLADVVVGWWLLVTTCLSFSCWSITGNVSLLMLVVKHICPYKGVAVSQKMTVPLIVRLTI